MTDSSSERIQRYLDAYEYAVRAVVDLAAQCPPRMWHTPTDCPGWTVADQVAHVTALESELAGEPAPPELPSYPQHVRGELGKHIEHGVVAYRRDDPTDAAEQLRVLADRRFGALRSARIDPAAQVPGLLGSPVPWPRLLSTRIFDVWTHEHDIRRALGLPSDLTGPAAHVVRQSVLDALPMLVARKAGAPAGSAVGFAVTGPQAFRATVQVDDQHRGALAEGVDPSAATVLRTDFDTLTRLVCGRIDPSAAAVTVDGDQELGRTVLANLTLTP